MESRRIVTADDPWRWLERHPSPLAEAAARGSWRGTANRLSADRVEWPLIDEVAAATRYPGVGEGARVRGTTVRVRGATVPDPTVRGAIVRGAIVRGAMVPGAAPLPVRSVAPSHPRTLARPIILSRRSALAFDGRGVLDRDVFLSMLRRLRPPAPLWDAIDWPPQVHLVLFVHRVQDLVPGVYAYLRDAQVRAEWQAAMRPEFLWEPVNLSPEQPEHRNLSTRAPEHPNCSC